MKKSLFTESQVVAVLKERSGISICADSEMLANTTSRATLESGREYRM